MLRLAQLELLSELAWSGVRGRVRGRVSVPHMVSARVVRVESAGEGEG